MPVSERQKSLKKKKIIFGLISTLMWLATGITLAICAFTKLKDTDSSGTPILSPEAQAVVTSVGVTIIIGAVIAIIIKDKIRTAVYMGSLVLGTILFKEVGMYVILGIWFTDEYVIYKLYKKFKEKYNIRKEIDLG